MKRMLPCLAILLMAVLSSTGCATSSGGGRQSAGANSSVNAPPPGQVYTPAVAVPPANP